MGNEWTLWLCCLGPLCLGGLGVVVAKIGVPIARAVMGRRRAARARAGVLSVIQRRFDPQNRGLVRGAPAHFEVRGGVVPIEVKTLLESGAASGIPAHITDQQVDLSPVNARGSVHVTASWATGAGPTFTLERRTHTWEPTSLDDAYALAGPDAALVREWLEAGALRGMASDLYPWALRSDGRALHVAGAWSADASGGGVGVERLAAALRWVDVLARTAIPWPPAGPYGR